MGYKKNPTELWSVIGTFLLAIIFICHGPHQAWALSEVKKEDLNILEGAKKEKKLLVYGSVETSEGRILLRKFQEKYPFIETEYFRQGSPKVLTKILLETQAGKYSADIYLIDILSTPQLKQRNLLMRYISPEAKRYPNDFKDLDGYYTGFVLQTYPVGYNPKLIPRNKVPTSYQDLLDPRWKGKLAMVRDNYKWFATLLDYMGEKKGVEFMEALARQEPTYYDGHTLVAQLLAAGEFPITVTIHEGTAIAMKNKGAPVEMGPFEPTPCMIKPVAISSRAPHLNAAKLFYDFLLSRAGEEVMMSFYRPTVSSIPKGMKLHFMKESIFPLLPKYEKQFNQIFLKKHKAARH